MTDLDNEPMPWCEHCQCWHHETARHIVRSITMNYLLSMERHPGTTEVHGFHLGTDERIARGILEDKMRTCRENDWPMVTMALVQNGRVVDTLYRDGKWHSRLAWES